VSRFLNADEPAILVLSATSPMGANLFAYCNNNAVNNVDHSGYFAIQTVCAAIGAICGGLLGKAVADYFDVSWWKKGLIIAGFIVGGAVVGWFAPKTIATIIKKLLFAYPSVAVKLAPWMLNGIGFANYVANKAASAVENFFVKSKHLMYASGTWAKFATTSQSIIQGWISEALKNGSKFVLNSEDSYYVIYNMGRVIGTNGEKSIKVVFTFAGRIITAFPVK
jgi:hypothetical protein